ncbi:hypothetical protein VTN02DRAFT_2637 [Thermoascus thermophilus]
MSTAEAPMRCHPGPLHHLLPLPPPQARMQDRIQLQAHREAQPECGDGAGDRRAEKADCERQRQCGPEPTAAGPPAIAGRSREAGRCLHLEQRSRGLPDSVWHVRGPVHGLP